MNRLLREELPAAAAHGANQHGGGERATLSSHNDTSDGVTARLKRDDPELAAQVIAG